MQENYAENNKNLYLKNVIHNLEKDVTIFSTFYNRKDIITYDPLCKIVTSENCFGVLSLLYQGKG
jgi:hypothetical protein